LQASGKIGADVNPIANAVAAVSVGIIGGTPLLDLCYTEDVAATVDMNIVMTAKGEFIELQGTGEEATFSDGELTAMLGLARAGVKELLALQQSAINAG
jgi:ribonuclease PH